MIKKSDFNKSIVDYIVNESRSLMNNSYYKDMYYKSMSPDSVPDAAGAIAEDVTNLMKSLFLVFTGRTIGYDNLIDVYNYIEAHEIHNEFNPKIWDEISLNAVKWGRWHKLYQGSQYGLAFDDVVSLREVNECEYFCEQLRKYIEVFIRRLEE